MRYIGLLTNSMGILLFCGFMSLFILPKLFCWLFYVIPQTIRFWNRGKIRGSAFLPTLSKIGVWVTIILALYFIAFVSDVETSKALVFSPTAIVGWLIMAFKIAWTLAFERACVQDEFYMEIYLKYIKPDVKKRYDAYTSAVGKLNYTQALEEKKKKLSYPQKKAVKNRILFLENETRENGAEPL